MQISIYFLELPEFINLGSLLFKLSLLITKCNTLTKSFPKRPIIPKIEPKIKDKIIRIAEIFQRICIKSFNAQPNILHLLKVKRKTKAANPVTNAAIKVKTA